MTVRATASDNRRVRQRGVPARGGKAVVRPHHALRGRRSTRPGSPRARSRSRSTRSTSRATAPRRPAAVTLDPTPTAPTRRASVKMTAGFGKQPLAAAGDDRLRQVDASCAGGSPTAAGTPISGAVIRVATRVLTGDRGFRELPPVSTGAGRRLRLPRAARAVAADPADLHAVRRGHAARGRPSSCGSRPAPGSTLRAGQRSVRAGRAGRVPRAG